MNDVIFYIETNIKFSTTWHYCFWRKWSDMSTVPRMGTSIFYNILRTNMTLAFVFYCDVKYFPILRCPFILFATSFWVVVVKNGRSLLDHSKICYISLKNEVMKWTDISHADTNLGKFNIKLIILGFGGYAQKWSRPLKSWDSKIRCISKMIWWIEQIDWMAFACW